MFLFSLDHIKSTRTWQMARKESLISHGDTCMYQCYQRKYDIFLYRVAAQQSNTIASFPNASTIGLGMRQLNTASDVQDCHPRLSSVLLISSSTAFCTKFLRSTHPVFANKVLDKQSQNGFVVVSYEDCYSKFYAAHFEHCLK